MNDVGEKKYSAKEGNTREPCKVAAVLRTMYNVQVTSDPAAEKCQCCIHFHIYS